MEEKSQESAHVDDVSTSVAPPNTTANTIQTNTDTASTTSTTDTETTTTTNGSATTVVNLVNRMSRPQLLAFLNLFATTLRKREVLNKHKGNENDEDDILDDFDENDALNQSNSNCDISMEKTSNNGSICHNQTICNQFASEADEMTENFIHGFAKTDKNNKDNNNNINDETNNDNKLSNEEIRLKMKQKRRQLALEMKRKREEQIAKGRFGAIFDNENDLSQYQLIYETLIFCFIRNIPKMPNEIACIISEFATGKLVFCDNCHNPRKELLILQSKPFCNDYQTCKFSNKSNSLEIDFKSLKETNSNSNIKKTKKKNEKEETNELKNGFVCLECANTLEKKRHKCSHCNELILEFENLKLCENEHCFGNVMTGFMDDNNNKLNFRNYNCIDCCKKVKCLHCWKIVCHACHGICDSCAKTDPNLCSNCYNRCANFAGEETNNNTNNNNNNDNDNNNNNCRTRLCQNCVKRAQRCHDCKAAICVECCHLTNNQMENASNQENEKMESEMNGKFRLDNEDTEMMDRNEITNNNNDEMTNANTDELLCRDCENCKI